MPKQLGTVVFVVALIVADLLLVARPVLADDPQPVLHELRGVDELRELFNKEKGVPRMVLLFSPT